MEKPQIIKFEIEHLKAIDWREDPDRAHVAHIEDGIALMRTRPYTAFSGVAGGKLLGAAGVIDCGYGVGYAWVVVAPEIERHKLWFHRAVRQYLRAILRTNGYRRLQAEALKCSKRNREWLEVLGFKARPYVIYELEAGG
jgi:hypothetical protein